MNSFFLRAKLLLCALLAALAYICVHEGGHALAGMAAGRRVSDVRIFSLTPGLTLIGRSTPAGDAFAAAAGSGLVVALWAFCEVTRRRPTVLSEAASFFAGIELLAWLVSAAAHRIAPPGNDVTKFITLSGAHPAKVAMVVACVGAACAAMYLRDAVVPSCEASPHSSGNIDAFDGVGSRQDA